MTLCTVYLFREPTTVKCEPGNIRDVQTLKCEWCDETYIFEYEATCTDSRDLTAIRERARVAILQEHTSGHRSSKLEIANRSRPIHPTG